MASTTIPIGSIPQWQLLQAVSPAFSSPDLNWAPLCPVGDLCIRPTPLFGYSENAFGCSRQLTIVSKDHSHNAVTNDSVKLLRLHLSEIPLYANSEDELSPTHHGLFAFAASALLSTMEETVDPGIPRTSGNNDGLDPDSVYSNELLQLKWPRLLGLAYLQHKGQTWASHLVLRQDPSVFKTLQAEAVLFVNIAEAIIPRGAVQMTKPPGEPSRGGSRQRQDDTAQARELFCGYSKRLFAGIVRRLAGCQRPHKALLHLKGPSDAHDGEPTPKLSMFVAFCPERDTWQQVVCSEHVAGTGFSPDGVPTDVDGICELARSCSENGCILGVELKGDTLLDTSDQRMDEELSLLDNASVTKFTLDELLRQGIFHKAHGVYPNDKKILAYILARALLCLYGGPWLQTPWSADKLVFRYDAAAHTIHDVHQPYILCDLLEDLPPPVSGKLHQSPLVLAFARILVDLDQGCADGAGDATDGALLKTLIRYYNENSDRHFSPGYKKALHSSIFFNKHLMEIRGKNPNATIQDAILEGIVNPLEKDVHMDKKDQWGSRNVQFKNNTFVMSQPTIPGRPPRTQHPTTALPNRPQTGSSTAASRPSVRATPTRPRPASRVVTPTGTAGTARTARAAGTGTRTAARKTAVPTKPAAAPSTTSQRHIQSARSSTLPTTNVGYSMSRKVPEMHINEVRSDSKNNQTSPSFG